MKKIKKFKKAAKKPFIIALNDEIDKKVNEALMMVERGFIDKGAYTIEELMVNHSDYHRAIRHGRRTGVQEAV
jgi:hypothetical protein